MGVSLSLQGTQHARSRRRGGQHSRTAEEQACLDALAALLHADAAGASRCLSRVSRLGLASLLVPAAQALARAADLELSSDASAASRVRLRTFACLPPGPLRWRCRDQRLLVAGLPAQVPRARRDWAERHRVGRYRVGRDWPGWDYVALDRVRLGARDVAARGRSP